MRNQSMLANETNSWLMLPNLKASAAGTYSLIVSNFVGAVTSLIATVTVEVPLHVQIQLMEVNNQRQYRLAGVASQGFVLQHTTNFQHWIPLWTNPVPYAPLLYMDAPTPSLPRRFYRARPWP
jgi:hypothetical protein